MNAFAHDEGCDGHGWDAVRAILTGAALATASLAIPADAADWSLSGGADPAAIVTDDRPATPSTPQHGLVPLLVTDITEDEENAVIPMDAPLAELAQAIEQEPVDFGFEADGGMPLPATTIVQDEEPLTEYVVSDEAKAAARRCPRWTAQVDALLLWQTNIPSRPLYADSVTGQTVLNANQAIPPVSAAPRYAILYHRDPCHAFEINYFQIQSFAGTAAVGAGTNTYRGVNLPGVVIGDITSAQVDTTAGLKSWEFNARRSDGGILTWIGGFRWVEWNQQLNLVGANLGVLGNDQYLVQTGNNLYGGQLGADLLLWNSFRKVKVNGVAKGGVYYNCHAYQNTTLSGGQGVFAANTLATSKDACSFMGEVGLIGEYKLAEWLSWRAGYTLFWLGGIATPSNQLALSDFTAQTTSINTYSSAFLHGVTTGLEARW
ncbi:MAG: hypothetical protein EBR28_02530 [Planctomycetia bacterium]|nr:hypothetical protein [Planctomycetia bacterium]